MAKNFQAICGMNDILPDKSEYWWVLEKTLRDIATQYGYKEIRTPFLEFTNLFTRTIGETTDIVTKEMYTFNDRNGDSLALRPEGTASCVRAGIEHGLLYNKIQRLFYYGPMFRYDRPQKGRYRQFHQFGVEAYGLKGPDIDAEIILLSMCFWRALKIAEQVALHINTVGNTESRTKYRAHLIEYLQKHAASLDEDSKRRLVNNPLRILDSKNPALQEIIRNAPKIIDHLDTESQNHFAGLCAVLDAMKIPYIIDHSLVRGLDYYSHTVFEWLPIGIEGAQSTICGGGRYDNLVAEMGGKATPGIGFAIGMERLLALVQDNLSLPQTDIFYLVMLGNKAIAPGLLLAEKLRNNRKAHVIVNCGGGDLSTQLKRADKSGAKIALILGEAELASGKVLIKYLRSGQPQQQIDLENIENIN